MFGSTRWCPRLAAGRCSGSDSSTQAVERSESTCWTVIRDAAGGDREARGLFAERYEGIVRAYFKARWRGTRHLRDLDDAVQDVFTECFRSGGVLDRLDPSRPGGFRAFLYGVIRIVALHFEAARGGARSTWRRRSGPRTHRRR